MLDNQSQLKNNRDHQTKPGHCLTPFQRQLLQKSLQDNLTEQYRQRLQIMLLADEGKTQIQICQTLGCSPSTVRHWTFIAQAGLAHKWDDNPIGRPKTANEQYLERLKELVSQSPQDWGYSFRRWTARWLSKHLAKEFGVEVSDRHINRLLKEMGLSTRPKLALTEDATLKTDVGNRLIIRDLYSGVEAESVSLWQFSSIL